MLNNGWQHIKRLMPTSCKDCKNKGTDSPVIKRKIINSCLELLATPSNYYFQRERTVLAGGILGYLESAGVHSFFDKRGLFLRGIFSGWGIFMAGEDGAHTAFWMRRELINVEVLSGGIDGPTFTIPCAPL